MTRLWMILGIICLLVGFAGDFLPIIPGPLLSYLSLLFLQIIDKSNFSSGFLIIMGIIMVLITIFDYIIPVIGTKKMGGTKRGTRGSSIGLIVGVIVLPILGITIGPFGLIGLLGGPFVGAYIGEILYQKNKKEINTKKALNAAFGSFLGFLGGMFLKCIYTIVIAIYFFHSMIQLIK